MALELSVVSHGLPSYIQIRDQIRDAISSGRIRPGEKLPTVRGLSEQYGLSTSTVQRAYQELAREGWIANRRRIGCVVEDIMHRGLSGADRTIEAMHRLCDVLDQVHATGMASEEFLAVLKDIVAARWSREHGPQESAILISGDVQGAPVDVRDIEEGVGIPTRFVSLQALRAHGVWALGDIRRVKVLFAMFYRYAEVRTTLSALPLPIFPLTATSEPRTIQEAVRYNRPDVKIAVIAHDPEYIEPLNFSVGRLLFNCHVVGYATLDDVESVRRLVEQADLVVGSFWVRGENHSDLTRGKPTLALGTRISPDSLQFARQALSIGDTSWGMGQSQVARPVQSLVQSPRCELRSIPNRPLAARPASASTPSSCSTPSAASPPSTSTSS